jgi:hypothetical protein
MAVWCLEAYDTQMRTARTREYTTSKLLAEKWERIPRIDFTDSGHGIVFQAWPHKGRRHPLGRRMDHAAKHLLAMRGRGAP